MATKTKRTSKKTKAEAAPVENPPRANTPETANQGSKLPTGMGNRLDEPNTKDIRLTEAPSGH